MNGRETAIGVLVGSWKQLVASRDMMEVEMIESLHEQLQGGIQAWDMCDLELEEHPDLAPMLGYDMDDMTSGQVNEWRGIVTEAVRRYLKEVGAE